MIKNSTHFLAHSGITKKITSMSYKDSRVETRINNEKSDDVMSIYNLIIFISTLIYHKFILVKTQIKV